MLCNIISLVNLHSFTACGSSKPLPYNVEIGCLRENKLLDKTVFALLFYAHCVSHAVGRGFMSRRFRRGEFIENDRVLLTLCPLTNPQPFTARGSSKPLPYGVEIGVEDKNACHIFLTLKNAVLLSELFS